MRHPRKDAFEALYAEHGGAVRSYALRRASAAAAEDVVSEVFLVAWRRFDDVPPEPRGWLLGTARRVLANQRRGQGRQAALVGELQAHAVVQPPYVGDFAAGANDSDDGAIPAALVHRALAKLSEPDRELLQLLAWEELTPTEAARVLDLRLGTFTMRLSRARRRFKTALADAHREPTSDQLDADRLERSHV